MIPNLEIPIAGGLNVALPKMALVRQRFDDSRLDDVGQAVGEQMQRSEIRDRVRPGMKIAICLLYTSPSPRDRQKSRMPSSA